MPRLPKPPVSLRDRLESLSRLFSMIEPVPKAWLKTSGGKIADWGSEVAQSTLTLKTCEDYSELVKAWQGAMKWSKGLDSALVVMFASSMSTQFVGEQLWIKILGPASCGKTSLMEGLATAKKWYLSKDTIRGFHSGMRAESDKDLPLADLVNGMTLGTKDGDTLLKAPNLKQILAEGRALYDKVSRTNYRNFVNREYIGHRMTWHLAGTSALREIDDSELGARFLDVVVMDKIEDEFENEVGLCAATQEARNMLFMSDGKPESQHPEELSHAMALSGGYLDFLRSNALELAKTVVIAQGCLHRCNKLGKFVAFMRARPNKEGNSEREFSPRLVKQLTRLMISLAATLNRCSTDDEVMARVHQVAMDTSRGPTLDLVRTLIERPQGAEVRAIAALTHTNDDVIRTRLKFLRLIGVVETEINQKRWRITPMISGLYKEVKNA